MYSTYVSVLPAKKQSSGNKHKKQKKTPQRKKNKKTIETATTI